ncbi:AAA family ATPase [Rhodocyclaceae bacterium SMB388]
MRLESRAGALALARSTEVVDQLVEERERFKLLTVADMIATPPQPYILKPLLPSSGIAAIYGPAGSGKTFLVLDIASSIEGGSTFFGYKSKACPVVYCGLEGAGGLPQRARAIQVAKARGAGHRLRFITAPLSLLNPDDLDELACRIHEEGMNGGVVVIDTLNAASPGADENDSRDMGRIIQGAKRLQAMVGGLVLLVHHSGKDATRGLRGHSSLLAALDAAIEVRREGDRREWALVKSKDASDGEAHPFKLEVVELGFDEDGDPITSCVVQPLESTDTQMKKLNLPAGGNQRVIYDALLELLKKAGRFGMAGAPPTRPCLEIEEAVTKVRDRLTCEPKRRTERAREALTGLVNRGAIVLKEGWLWLA